MWADTSITQLTRACLLAQPTTAPLLFLSRARLGHSAVGLPKDSMFVSALMEDGIPEVVSQPPAAVRLDVPDAWVTVVARLPHPTDIFSK
jgi:hypothetical protein